MGLLDLLTQPQESNSFSCPYCKKHTRHKRISLSEWMALDEQPQAVGVICDIFQMGRLAGLAGIKHWKCTECGTATIRKLDGEIDTIASKRSK